MGIYVAPSSIVAEKGRKIETKRSFEETGAQLRNNERMCAYSKDPSGEGFSAFVPIHGDDFDEIVYGLGKRFFIEMYAIGPDIIAHAH